MKNFWNFMFRGAGLSFCACAVVFLSLPTASTWKQSAGIACAMFGSIFFVAMYFAKKMNHAEEVHLVNRELTHHESDIDHHLDGK